MGKISSKQISTDMATDAEAVTSDDFTGKGYIPAGTGAGAFGFLAPGVNDTVLTVDSSQATGMKWTGVPSQVSDTAYGAGWNGDTTVAPSKNAVYDQMELKAPLASPAFTGSPTITAGGSLEFLSGQGVTYDGFISHVSSSPYDTLYIDSKGGVGGWVGRIIFRVNVSAGSLLEDIIIDAGSGVTIPRLINGIGGWAHINQTGAQAIVDSYNVSSITDNGVGRTIVTWDTDFANANYSASGICDGNVSVVWHNTKAAGSVEFGCYHVTNGNQDNAGLLVIAVGDR